MANAMKNKNLIILAVVVVLFVVGIVMTRNANSGKLAPAELKSRLEAYIKSDLLSDGTQFTISDPTPYNNGIYQMDITISGSPQAIKSYATVDGKLFFPQGLEVVTPTSTPADGSETGDNPEDKPTAAPKTDKPTVELFVMSYCPYGTQIEKGIIPVVEALKGKINFQLKFVDYAMHGDKEIKENLVQYCLGKEQNDKLLPYLKCFLKDSAKADACLTEAKVDKKKLDACVAAADKQFKIMETYGKGEAGWGGTYPPFDVNKADNQKYSVQGSPSLIINGADIQSGRDAASLAKAICGAFTDGKSPKECGNTFSSAAPAPGFGEGTASGGATDAGCGQ